MGRKQLDKHRVATLLGVRQQSAPQPGHLGSAEGALVTHSAADGNHSRQLMLFFFCRDGDSPTAVCRPEACGRPREPDHGGHVIEPVLDVCSAAKAVKYLKRYQTSYR